MDDDRHSCRTRKKAHRRADHQEYCSDPLYCYRDGRDRFQCGREGFIPRSQGRFLFPSVSLTLDVQVERIMCRERDHLIYNRVILIALRNGSVYIIGRIFVMVDFTN